MYLEKPNNVSGKITLTWLTSPIKRKIAIPSRKTRRSRDSRNYLRYESLCCIDAFLPWKHIISNDTYKVLKKNI